MAFELLRLPPELFVMVVRALAPSPAVVALLCAWRGSGRLVADALGLAHTRDVQFDMMAQRARCIDDRFRILQKFFTKQGSSLIGTEDRKAASRWKMCMFSIPATYDRSLLQDHSFHASEDTRESGDLYIYTSNTVPPGLLEKVVYTQHVKSAAVVSQGFLGAQRKQDCLRSAFLLNVVTEACAWRAVLVDRYDPHPSCILLMH